MSSVPGPNLTPFRDNLHLFIRQGHDARNKVKVNKLIWDIRAQFDENKADKVEGGRRERRKNVDRKLEKGPSDDTQRDCRKVMSKFVQEVFNLGVKYLIFARSIGERRFEGGFLCFIGEHSSNSELLIPGKRKISPRLGFKLIKTLHEKCVKKIPWLLFSPKPRVVWASYNGNHLKSCVRVSASKVSQHQGVRETWQVN